MPPVVIDLESDSDSEVAIEAQRSPQNFDELENVAEQATHKAETAGEVLARVLANFQSSRSDAGPIAHEDTPVLTPALLTYKPVPRDSMNIADRGFNIGTTVQENSGLKNRDFKVRAFSREDASHSNARPSVSAEPPPSASTFDQSGIRSLNVVDSIAGVSGWESLDPAVSIDHKQISQTTPHRDFLEWHSTAVSSSASDTNENSHQCLAKFSIASLKPRFGLSEADWDFRSHYKDKQLVTAFKQQLEQSLRPVLLRYEERLPSGDLLATATKHVKALFKKVARAPQAQKRSLLRSVTESNISREFEKRLRTRERYIRRNSNLRLHGEQSFASSAAMREIGEETHRLETNSYSDSNNSTRMESSGSEEPTEDLIEDASLQKQRSYSMRRGTQSVNYNVRALFGASKRGQLSTGKLPPVSFGKDQSTRYRKTLEGEPRLGRQSRRQALLRARELGYGHFGCLKGGKELHQDLMLLELSALKPWRQWTGAAKDIVTTAWAPDGLSYVVGSSADMDSLNVQYNRPNNLLFGNLERNTISELPDHHIDRPRPETITSGSNSWIDTYNAVDPRLFTTITSVCFDHSSRHLYTGSYDHTVKVWSIRSEQKPICTSTIKHGGKVNLVSLSRDSTLLATAQQTYDWPIQVFKAQGDSELLRQFHPERSKGDLRLYPSALQWGITGHTESLLLAGFMEGKLNDERDREGYIGLWDVVSNIQHKVTPCTQTIFDLAWNPVRPIFAAASTTGNRTRLTNRYTTRSLIRVYGPLQGPSCLLEYECPAIDINEVCFHPTDERYISASCTDGTTYIWDERRPDRVVHKLCHGAPHDPLNYRSQEAAARQREREELDTGVRFVTWDECGSRILTGSSDGVIKSWNPGLSEDDVFVTNLAQFDSNIMTGQFSPDFTNLLVGLSKGSVQILSCAPSTTQLNEKSNLVFASPECQLLDYEPASRIDSEDETAGLKASKDLLQSSQVILHPVYGAGQGPCYRGPFSRYARNETSNIELAKTELCPEWLVRQLHPEQRKIGVKRGGIPTAADKKQYRNNGIVAWARWQKFHPDDWKEIQGYSRGYHNFPSLQGDSQKEASLQQQTEYEPFWGGLSAQTSRSASPMEDPESPNLNVSADTYGIHFGNPIATLLTAQGPEHYLAEHSNIEQEPRDIVQDDGQSSPGNHIKPPSTPTKTPSKILTSFPQWREPPAKVLSSRERREMARGKIQAEALEAARRGYVIDLEEL